MNIKSIQEKENKMWKEKDSAFTQIKTLQDKINPDLLDFLLKNTYNFYLVRLKKLRVQKDAIQRHKLSQEKKDIYEKLI